ncbi:MAG: ROK family protein [Acidobacteriota bacterium]
MRILALESGGTKLVAALVDEKARVLERRRRRRDPGSRAADTVAQLIALGRELLGGGDVAAVGWGFGGVVRRSDGFPLHCYHEPGWGAYDAPGRLREAFQVPVFTENDGNLAALAEAWPGVDEPPERSLLYVTLGTGVGGGFVQAGRIFCSGDAGEVEIGHVVHDPAGPPCPCGNRGCVEQYCSGPAVERRAAEVTGRRWSGAELMAAFRSGDAVAGQVAAEAAGVLGRALAAAVNLLAAEVVVLGGGLSQDNDPFVRLVEKETRPFVFPPFREGLRFRRSRWGEDVVCRGAAIHALQQLGVWPEVAGERRVAGGAGNSGTTGG